MLVYPVGLPLQWCAEVEPHCSRWPRSWQLSLRSHCHRGVTTKSQYLLLFTGSTLPHINLKIGLNELKT